MQLRPYQAEAIDALDHHWRTRDDNPLVVLPTGAGKTIVLAELIRRYLTDYPGTRICVLVHVRELVKQNACKLAEHWPEAPLGVYSASLNARDTQAAVIFASIQSVFKRADALGAFDLVFIDEAHRVPLTGDGQYRQFLEQARTLNPHLRVLGLTATPYRLGRGLVFGPDYILNTVAYEASVRRLIDEGYLSRLTSKATETEVSARGVTVRGGEYVASELEARVNEAGLVERAVAEMVARLADRRAWIIFCAGVDHAHSVRDALATHGIGAPVIHAKTPAQQRESLIAAFGRGEVRALCNVNVLSEGFDAPHVDAVVLLRPTKSAGLYYQQVGRGFRLHPGKDNCLVLDFAGNVREHGPVDLIRVREQRKRGQPVTEGAPTKACPKCHELVHAAVMQCPECGYAWPRAEAKHEERPDTTPILSEPPSALEVTRVAYSEHLGRSGIPSLRVDYYCGMQRVSEYVCLEHEGYARRKAEAWWKWRYSVNSSKAFDAIIPLTVSEAVMRINLSLRTQYLPLEPTHIHVDFSDKYPRIVRYDWPDPDREGGHGGEADRGARGRADAA